MRKYLRFYLLFSFWPAIFVYQINQKGMDVYQRIRKQEAEAKAALKANIGPINYYPNITRALYAAMGGYTVTVWAQVEELGDGLYEDAAEDFAAYRAALPPELSALLSGRGDLHVEAVMPHKGLLQPDRVVAFGGARSQETMTRFVKDMAEAYNARNGAVTEAWVIAVAKACAAVDGLAWNTEHVCEALNYRAIIHRPWRLKRLT